MPTHSDIPYQDTLTSKLWTSGQNCICPQSKTDAMWRGPGLVTNGRLWPYFFHNRRDEIARVPDGHGSPGGGMGGMY